MSDSLDRLTIDPGKPCIRGLRITVYDILEYLAGGMSEAEILAAFPDSKARTSAPSSPSPQVARAAW